MRLRLLLLAFLLCASSANAQLRFEAGIGKCRYGAADDTNWYYNYGGYRNTFKWNPTCANAALLWMPKASRWGARLSYVDLGTITADNTYPVNEQAYKTARDAHTSFTSATGYYQAHGGSKGLTLGAVYEHPALGLIWQGEAGIAALYNTWHVYLGNQSPEWKYADGWNYTPYIGGAARWRWLITKLDVFQNVHANGGTDQNPMNTGPTSGVAWQATVGLSVPL